MKLEIDIDEDYYKIICKKVQENKPFHSPYEHEVIADGKPLEQEPTQTDEIPKDYIYDTETKDFLVYRHKYTGDEIHIKKSIPIYTLEQEPKSEWEQDHAILKAYSDGANEVLDKLRAEFETIIGEHNWDDYDFCSGLICARKIIDKYKKKVR